VRALLIPVFIVAALSLAACAERDQLAQGERTYQGKPDTQAWDNEPLDYPLNHASKWTKGDHASWQHQIKARQLTQNEYQRTGR
jgi:hypothetical protein